jgi:pectate lyase-like protein
VAQIGAGFGSGYPGSIDTRQTYRNTDSAAPDSDTRLDAEFCNDVLAALIQLETALGANVNGAYGSLAARLEALILQGGGVETGGSTALSNVVAFAVPMQIVIPGLAHQQAAPALLYQVYDTATPPNAIQPNSVSVHPTTFDVVMTFATSQVGTAMVANPLPSVLIPFTNEVNLVIPGTTHGLAQTFLLFQVYDTQIPAQAIQPQNFSVNPTSKDVTLTFAFPQSGSLRLSAGSPRYTQTFGALTTWTIPASTHGLGSANLLWQCYDTSANPQAIQPQGVSVSATGDVVVTFALAQAGTIVLVPVPFVPSALAAKPLAISVGTTGARGDGVTNDSPAVQAAITRAITEGIRHVVFPPGSYLLNTPVTITNTSLQVSGAGMEVTRLLVNNTTGGLFFTSSGPAAGSANGDYFYAHDFTLIAVGTGAQNRGTALRAIWPAPSTVPAALCLAIERVSIRSQEANSDNLTQPYFTVGMDLQNAHNTRLRDIHVMQLSNQAGTLLWLNNAHNAAAYRVTIDGLELLGGYYGLRVTGWVEDVQVSHFEIAGPAVAIQVDGSTSDIRNPALMIADGHINGRITGIYIRNWADIHVHNCSCYVFPLTPSNTGATTLDVLYLQDCINLTVSGCYFSNGILNSNEAVNLVRLVNVKAFAVTGNTFHHSHNNSMTAYGVAVSIASTLGVVNDNVFFMSGTVTNTTGILLQPEVVNTDQLTVQGNRFENVDTGIIGSDLANALIADNVYLGTGTPLMFTGTVGAQVIVRGNHPIMSRLLLAINIANPPVAGAPDGLLFANNTAPTTITTLLNGYEGMVVEILTSNGNTTVQHNAGLILAGAANVLLTPASILTLRWTFGAWRELGRTII